MNKYNLEKLVKIELIDSEIADGYYWIPNDKKFFWFKTSNMGLYFLGQYQGVVFPKHLKLDTIGVCLKPRVVLSFQGGVAKIKYYDTFDEAKVFFEKITKDKKFLEI